MKNTIVALITGFLFALGLGLAGMTQPQKVLGFLDVFGNWDPSLMFVMMGAIGVHALAYVVAKKRATPLFASEWQIPQKKDLTPALIVGATLFGVGWGLAGYCPGPALVSLASFTQSPLIFFISLVAGMVLFIQVDKRVHFRK